MNLPNPLTPMKMPLGRPCGKRPTWPDLAAAPFVQLFDVAKDPHEDKNLAAEHPERVAAMVKLLRKQVNDGRSTPGAKLPLVRRVNINARLPDFVRKALKK